MATCYFTCRYSNNNSGVSYDISLLLVDEYIVNLIIFISHVNFNKGVLICLKKNLQPKINQIQQMIH